MADPELPRPRPHRVPSASSSHSDLLHTIAQLREQRIAAASATSSSPSSSAAASSSSSQKPPSYRSHLYSSSSHRSSNASGSIRFLFAVISLLCFFYAYSLIPVSKKLVFFCILPSWIAMEIVFRKLLIFLLVVLLVFSCHYFIFL
jgi:hypothetical protein